jgi:hypothetical protein
MKGTGRVLGALIVVTAQGYGLLSNQLSAGQLLDELLGGAKAGRRPTRGPRRSPMWPSSSFRNSVFVRPTRWRATAAKSSRTGPTPKSSARSPAATPTSATSLTMVRGGRWAALVHEQWRSIKFKFEALVSSNLLVFNDPLGRDGLGEVYHLYTSQPPPHRLSTLWHAKSWHRSSCQIASFSRTTKFRSLDRCQEARLDVNL